jgi:alkylhydroperoxidase family enzyme
MTAWIDMIADDDASTELKDVLDHARTPHGTVDNVMRVHSLRPNTMKGHVALYRAALHDSSNTIPMWFQETISSYVSMLNNCPYSLENHWKNAVHLMDDLKRAKSVEMVQEDVIALRASGADDGQILELNQIIGYFNYVNRLLNGLGVTTIGDTVGFYKSTESNLV